jgi:hypothetical protein
MRFNQPRLGRVTGLRRQLWPKEPPFAKQRKEKAPSLRVTIRNT